MKKSKIVGEFAVMEVSLPVPHRLRTRARTPSLQRLPSPPPENTDGSFFCCLEKLIMPITFSLRKLQLQSSAGLRFVAVEGCCRSPNLKEASSRLRVSPLTQPLLGRPRPGADFRGVDVKMGMERSGTEGLGVESSQGLNNLEFEGRERMMSDYKVELINDGMHEFYVDFNGPKERLFRG